MTTLALIVALAAPQCPEHGPGDLLPVILMPGCPAPVPGLLYSLAHEDVDAQASAALMGARIAIVDLKAIAKEHADEPHPFLYIAGGAIIGAGLTWLALSVTP